MPLCKFFYVLFPVPFLSLKRSPLPFQHRQGWFTYSYCHNSHVRQFREAAHTHPHPIGASRSLPVFPPPFSPKKISISSYPLLGYKPEEDTEVRPLSFLTCAVLSDTLPSAQWEAYTLGQAPATTPESGADLTVAEQNALAVNLELARGTGSRYLVQRWGDGTICDKTGRDRETEIQVPPSRLNEVDKLTTTFCIPASSIAQ